LIGLLRKLLGKKQRRRVAERRVVRPGLQDAAGPAAHSLSGLEFRLPQDERAQLVATPIQVKGTFGRNAVEPLPKRRRR